MLGDEQLFACLSILQLQVSRQNWFPKMTIKTSYVLIIDQPPSLPASGQLCLEPAAILATEIIPPLLLERLPCVSDI